MNVDYSKIKQPLQHNLRTFNITDSIENIEKPLKFLYGIELKDIIDKNTYNTLAKNTLVTRPNFNSYYTTPKNFYKAIRKTITIIFKNVL